MTPFARLLAFALAMTALPADSGAAPAAGAADTVFITVSQDGSGDATTIQQGLALATGPGLPVVRVMPGHYAEVVQIGPPPAAAGEILAATPADRSATQISYGLILVAPGGPAQTTVHGFAPTGLTDALIAGFTIETTVTHGVSIGWAARWEDCVFMGGYSSRVRGAPNLARCEFRGPVRLDGYASHAVAFEDLRFVGGGLQLWARNEGDFGPLEFMRCAFEGPADTGAVAHPSGENYIGFSECVFADLQFGIVAEAGCSDQIRVVRSRFSDVARSAVHMDRTGEAYDPFCPSLSLSVSDSRFERCGQAVKWWPVSPPPGARAMPASPDADQATNVFGPFVELSADTVLDCSGIAIEMRVQYSGAALSDLRVSGGGGAGIALTNVSDRAMQGNVSVQNSEIRSNQGSGIVLVEQTADVARQQPVRWIGNRVSRNGGHGIHAVAQDVQASLNVIDHNGGDGLRLHTPGTAQASDVGLNTLVLNHGAGLRHTIEPGGDGAAVLLHHNLAVQNEGEGIAGQGIIRHNDAWMNAGGDYLGPLLEDNLSADPAFCDPYADDFSLIQGSVCAPDGPYGQIGALGIGCAPTATRVALRSAEVVDGAVRVSWFAGGDAVTDARVERRAGGGEWAHVGSTSSDGSGMLRYEEPAPGTGRYGYRLVAAGAPLGDEAWVEVADVSFAMRVPNPVRGRPISVELSLPGLREVTVELLDVAGRRLKSVRVAPRAPAHTVVLGTGVGLAPGVYVVRVTRGAESLTGRAVVIR